MRDVTIGRTYDPYAMKSPFAQMLLRWIVLALGVMLATKIVPGIACDDGTTLIAVVLLLSFFNLILKPLLVLFTLPFIILTMGLGIVVINALLFMLVDKLVVGFRVETFWSAVGASLVVSVTNWLVSWFVRNNEKPRPRRDDVIDV